jgi:hypothetical protein
MTGTHRFANACAMSSYAAEPECQNDKVMLILFVAA